MHSIGAPQVYPVCIQANLKSSGSVVPSETVKFPAAYNINDGFKTFNIWTDDPSTFVPPGPAVYSGGSSGGGGRKQPVNGSASSSQHAPAPAPTSSPTDAADPAPNATDAATPSPSTTDAATGSSAGYPTVAPSPAPAPHPTRVCKRDRAGRRRRTLAE